MQSSRKVVRPMASAGQKEGGQTHTYHTMCTRGSTAKPRTSSNAATPIATFNFQRRHVALRMRSCIAS
jgi:hypothetical protein